jgi:hypothetical protein
MNPGTDNADIYTAILPANIGRHLFDFLNRGVGLVSVSVHSVTSQYDCTLKTAKAAANAAKERQVHMGLSNPLVVHRAAKVARIAAAPMAKPQANEVIVHGYRRMMKPTNWLASQTAPVRRIAARRFKVRAAAVLNAAKGVAQAKPRLNATLAQTSKANHRW